MQITTYDMINNRIKRAKYQLSQHKVKGINSSLSIFEVAKLMDTVRSGEKMENNASSNIFFSMN